MTEALTRDMILPPYLDDYMVGPITPWSLNSIGLEMACCAALAPVSNAWPTAAKAIYVPFSTAEPITAVKMFWMNGGTAAGTIDVGIYDSDGAGGVPGAKIVASANPSQGTISVEQEVDITDTALRPNHLYYLAMSCSSGSATVVSSTGAVSGLNAPILQAFGCFTQVTANPLPATATPVSDAAWTFMPVFGISRKTMVV
ncbi:MAG: hypothetical protein V4537_07900 [Pseudomonadota bacterium]